MKGTDQDLLLLISRNDEDAFKFLFRKYRDKLFSYIFKITKSREVSEEIVMDVFMKLWQSREVLTEVDNFSSFIFLVARNKAYDFLRMAAKDMVLKELLWDEIEAVSESRSDQKILTDELQQKLDGVVKKLSPQRQSVFRLSREQNMTHDQIAAHLNLSKSTVKNHITDSLRFIREHIGANLDIIIACYIFFKK